MSSYIASITKWLLNVYTTIICSLGPLSTIPDGTSCSNSLEMGQHQLQPKTSQGPPS